MSQLTIFVSGTIDDLLAERNAIGTAIESLRLDAVRAETQYSSERSSREECLKMARECDVYLGVYNPARFGWTIPGDDISVTEMEFNASRNKPTLIFVKKIPRDQWDAKQKAFLDRVLDFDGGKFRAVEFESTTQLEDQVAGALMQLLVERFKMSVTRPPFLAPRHNPNNFVGRRTQIDELMRAFVGARSSRPGSMGGMTPPLLVHGLHLLAGVGGLGKTELALHIAHTMRDEFDGGVLWADLPTVLPSNTLADWAREYDADVSKIENVDERARALRDALRVRGRRVLAVLDGAVDESDDEKIAPLLRALADCAVIVTSRVTQLASLHDAQPIDLDRMGEDETWELFSKHVDAARLTDKRNVIAAIGAVVDLLPLALDLAAAQLREHKSWTPDDVLAMVRDERTRLDTLKYGDGKMRGVRASFDVTYKRLTQDEQNFFAGLGAFGGIDFDVHAAAYVTETTDDVAREWLERFQRLSLVQEGRRAFRYKLHPLIRDFARERAVANIKIDKRMSEYYFTLTKERLHDLSAGDKIALGILDYEITNISAGSMFASRQVSEMSTRELSGLEQLERAEFMMFYEACVGSYAHAKMIESFQKMLEIQEKLGDILGISETYWKMGKTLENTGDLEKAIQAIEKAVAIKRDLAHPLWQEQFEYLEQLRTRFTHQV